MTKLEQAARQALEALERLEGLHLSRGITCSGIITAMREALAEPTDEPVMRHPDGQTNCADAFLKQFQTGNMRMPADEPVARVAEVHMSRYTIEWTNGPLPEGTELFYRPQPASQWVGLTDDELSKVFNATESARDKPWFIRYANAVESKLKEKNT